MPSLDLKVPNKLLCQTPGNCDKVLIAISKYQTHPSINSASQSFSFKTVSCTDKEKEKNMLDTNKASHSSDTPKKLLKQNLDFFSSFTLGYVSKPISLSTFPSILKLADITPVYKKDP